MKKLSNDLKKLLTGFAHADAGEFLPTHEKMKVLGYGEEAIQVPSMAPWKAKSKPATKLIALISDGKELGAPLDYAIDACSRQGAKIALLIHGTVDTTVIPAMENRIRAVGLDYDCIQIGTDATEAIFDYVYNHPSLIFMVAMANDDVARTLVEEVIPKRGVQMSVPLVLIENRAEVRAYQEKAA